MVHQVHRVHQVPRVHRVHRVQEVLHIIKVHQVHQVLHTNLQLLALLTMFQDPQDLQVLRVLQALQDRQVHILQPQHQRQHVLIRKKQPLKLQPKPRLKLQHQVEQADLVVRLQCGQETESLIILVNVYVTTDKRTKLFLVILLKKEGLQA